MKKSRCFGFYAEEAVAYLKGLAVRKVPVKDFKKEKMDNP